MISQTQHTMNNHDIFTVQYLLLMAIILLAIMTILLSFMYLKLCEFMEEYKRKSQHQENKIGMSNPFKVFEATNGRGTKNLMIEIVPAIPDIEIGNSLIVPMPNGYKIPVSVDVVVDDNGIPIRTNLNTCVVLKYNYE